MKEMVASEAIMEHLLGELNSSCTNCYKQPDFIKQEAPYLANVLYYNAEKLIFQKKYITQSYMRDINMYKLYYNPPNPVNGDTAFVIGIVGHLKAGFGTENVNKRKTMATNTMNFIKGLDQNANYLMMGDSIIYGEMEPAWIHFTMNSNCRIDDITVVTTVTGLMSQLC